MLLVFGLNKKFPNSIHNIFKCLKIIFRLILMVGFITISPRTRFIVGVSLKQISTFLLWTVKYEDREKWIMDKPSWLPTQILTPSK